MSARQLQPCGTRAAYIRHVRAEEAADDACRAADRAYDRTQARPRATAVELDEVAVERAVAGDPPPCFTIAEREQVVRRLHRLGLTDGRIANHLDVTANGVLRIRRRLGLPAVVARRAAA